MGYHDRQRSSGSVRIDTDSLLRDNPTPLSKQQPQTPVVLQIQRQWLPSTWETSDGGSLRVTDENLHHYSDLNINKWRRSLRRRIFLILTEPESSAASAIFFGILVMAISLMNIVMVMQTMDAFQYTPSDCQTCGGAVSYLFDSDDDTTIAGDTGAWDGKPCVCPPTPAEWSENFLKWSIYFFCVEWALRVLAFTPCPSERAKTLCGGFEQWLVFVFWTPSTILDALAIFPYFLEAFDSNGLMSLRLLRLFRVFQLVRLGTYNETFNSLTSVLRQSLPYLKLLLGVLFFGAAFFGSIMYWLEKGHWKYHEDSESFQFVRVDHAGQETISPFYSIPAAFWWFFVTATTVGYGDTFPTSAAGKWVATMAMLTGVLVVAFPVSVFSDLWSKELRRAGLLALIDDDDDDENDGKDNGDDDTEKRSAFSHDLQYRYGSMMAADVTSPRSMAGSLPSTVPGSGEVVMDAEDLVELMSHIQSIQESQQFIRSILRKYKLPISRQAGGGSAEPIS